MISFSYLFTGTPVGALTGTADLQTQATIKKVLCLKECALTIYVSPNRPNLRFYVKKGKKEKLLDQLQWLVHMVKEKGKDTPKTIVFCNTMNEIATVVNYLIQKLGSAAYQHCDSNNQDNCYIGIYHSNSWQSSKDRILNSFKGNGVRRVVVATTALCMGVNFPDVRYVVSWGPARTILDQHQEAGRAGRDGKAAHIIVLYHGQQIGLCEKEVKEFVRAKGCLRVSAYQTLDPAIQPVQPPHDCCSFCSVKCKCAEGKCVAPTLPFEMTVPSEEGTNGSCSNGRQVTHQDRQDLKEALTEVQCELRSQTISIDESACHGFSTQLIDDIVDSCDNIFTIDDIRNNFPVFLFANALRILEVIQEIFLDVPHFEETLEFFTCESNLDDHIKLDFDSLTLGVESDTEF